MIEAGGHRPAAFLDRDGILNRDTGYVHRAADFEWMPGSAEAVKFLNDTGYLVFVVTNQAGIARGFYEPRDVENLHRWINAELNKTGAHIDAFYYCPHHPEAGNGEYTRDCDCRKPKPGMLRAAMSEWPVLTDKSFMIGDNPTDVQAGEAASIAAFLFEGDNILTAVRDIVERQGK